jgi:hypothetical protein
LGVYEDHKICALHFGIFFGSLEPDDWSWERTNVPTTTADELMTKWIVDRILWNTVVKLDDVIFSYELPKSTIDQFEKILGLT